MEMKLYKTNDDNNVINKKTTLIYTLNINIKDRTDMINPSIILNDNGTKDYLQCNYAYLGDFDRYYFIRKIESINDSNWALILECDVLETYKKDILNSDVEINRGLKKGEYFNTNPKRKIIKNIDVHKSNITLENKRNIILSTIGGSN